MSKRRREPIPARETGLILPEIDLMRRLTVSLAVVAVTAIAATSFAVAQSRVKSGVLECRGGASIGLVLGSSSMLTCVYRGDDRFEDRYVGIVRKVGLDLGITQEVNLAWAVF